MSDLTDVIAEHYRDRATDAASSRAAEAAGVFEPDPAREQLLARAAIDPAWQAALARVYGSSADLSSRWDHAMYLDRRRAAIAAGRFNASTGELKEKTP